MTEDANITFKADDEDVSASISQLLQTDVTEVEENYGPERLPAGTFHLRVKNAEVVMRTMALDKKKHPGVEVDRGVYSFEFEVLNVLSLKDPTLDEADYIGSAHYEGFAIFDFVRDTGKVKALIKQAGYVPPSNVIADMLAGFINHEFVGVIKQRKDRNDPDTVYSNLDLKACQPVATMQGAVAQPQAVAETSPPQEVQEAQVQPAKTFAFGS